ncbi:MAG TPA: hypothetical protein VFZ78_05550 [Flavisolibacter sp.]
MKKSFLLKLFLLVSVIAFSQQTRFRIVNAETGSPVSYATVKMLTRPGGAVASGSGTFRMEIRQHDTILVTYVGFAPLKIAGAQVRELIILSPRPA